MATAGEVLEFLIPSGGWLISGDEYSGITFLECDPITEKEFLDGFAKVDKAKKAAETKRITDREALLNKLGITAEEAALLLS
jgi:hypothetical protein